MRRWFVPVLTGALGLVVAGAAAMHIVAVTGVAYGERGGYDARLASLLFIGWVSLVCGLVMLGALPALVRGAPGALYAAAGGAGVFGVACAVMAPVSPGFAAGVPIFGGYVFLAAAVLNRRRDADVSPSPTPWRIT